MIPLDYEPLRRHRFRIPGWFARGLFLMIGAAVFPVLPWERREPAPPQPGPVVYSHCGFGS